MNAKDMSSYKTLADFFKSRGTLTRDEILTLLNPVMASLAKLHKKNRVHGHISPETIMLHDNSLLLFCCPPSKKYLKNLFANIKASGGSFGYTAALSENSGIYTANDAPYRALETYMAGPLTPAADIYSLCGVIYYAVFGAAPVTALNKMYDDIRPSMPYTSDADKRFMDMICKGTALLPKDRYEDIETLLAALNQPATAAKASSGKPAKRAVSASLPANFIKIFVSEYQKTDQTFNRDSITSITFYKTLDQAPENVIDVTAKKNGAIIAWAVKNKANDYSLYAASQDIIRTGADCSGMFAECKNLKKISFNQSFSTAAAVNMQKMFYKLPKLTSLSLKDFRTFKADNMSQMFWCCESLKSLNLKSFDTSAVTDMSGMFYGCRRLTSLDLSGFDTSNTFSMMLMFCSCLSLKTLDISHFDTSGVENMQSMFESCHGLNNQLKEIIADLNFSHIIGNGLTDMIKDTDFEGELTALSQSIASHPSIEQLFKPTERMRLLCEDFAAKYPKRYSTGISNVLKTGLGLTDEKVYLSHDDTWLKSGKNGFAVTDRGFVCRNFSGNPQALSFKDFKAVKEISPITSKLSDANILADEQPIVYVTGASDTEKSDLNHLIQSIQKTL